MATTLELNTQALASSLLVDLTINPWSGKKTIRKLAQELADAHGFDQRDGSVTILLVEDDEYTELLRLGRDCRNYHYLKTLPWGQRGARLLLPALYREYFDTVRDYRDRMEAIKASLKPRWQSIVDAQASRLNGLYPLLLSEGAYPCAEEVFSKGITIHTPKPVPAEDSYCDYVDEEHREALRQEAIAQVAEAQASVVERVTDALKGLIEKCTKSNARVHPGLILGITQVAELVPSLNIAGDPRLDALAGEVKALCAGLTDDTIREGDEEQKREIASKARALSRKAAQFSNLI